MQQGGDINGEAAGDYTGYSVSLLADGSTHIGMMVMAVILTMFMCSTGMQVLGCNKVGILMERLQMTGLDIQCHSQLMVHL